MAIHIHCPHCHERLEEMKTDCTHCGEALPPGVLFALSMALDGGSTPIPMAPSTTVPSHIHPNASEHASSLVHLPEAELKPPKANPPSAQPPQNSALRPWLAAGLSIFCGLGQLYNGQTVKGMILIILATALAVSFQMPWAKILIPLLWLYAIIDAYVVARRLQS